MIPFQICTVFLLIIEVIKQVKSFQGGIYDWAHYDKYSLPLHFCSLFIYMLPLMSFYHWKGKEHIRAITTTICGSLFALMLIYPNLIYSGGAIDDTFQTFGSFKEAIAHIDSHFTSWHTVVFHTIATFTFFLIIALYLHKPNAKKDSVSVLVFIIIYCIIGGSVAHILKTNYNNFYQCNIPPLQAVKDSIQPTIGYAATQILYVSIVSVLDILFTQGAYQLYRLLRIITVTILPRHREEDEAECNEYEGCKENEIDNL
jgi:hypothetical protein